MYLFGHSLFLQQLLQVYYLRFHPLSCGLYEISSRGLQHTYFYLDGNISGLMRKEQLSLSGVFPLKCLYSHSYLWVVDSKFTDWRAIPYIIANIVVITSITICMNIILEKYNNLIYSIFMHFGFNIVYVFLDADIGFFIILTLLYLFITPIAMHIRNRTADRL